MIYVKDLQKKYGDTVVLDNLSFEIPKGEILGFLGPNGAGKTTTMRILTGFLAPTQGQVKINDLDILSNSLDIRRQIGYLPENNPLYDNMLVYEYLEYEAEAKGLQNVKEEVKRVIKVCGLSERVAQQISELSKGFRQRVGLAQALLGDPEALILDEPTTGLDPNQIVEIRNLIKEIGQSKTIILSTHILQEVQATCDRVIIINHGQIAAQGTPEELKKQARGKILIKAVIEGPAEMVQDSLGQVQGIEHVEKLHAQENETAFELQVGKGHDVRKIIFRLCVEQGWSLLQLEVKETSLEDVFHGLTVSQGGGEAQNLTNSAS